MKTVVLEMKDKRSRRCWNLKSIQNKLATAASLRRCNKTVSAATAECGPEKDVENVNQMASKDNRHRGEAQKNQTIDENLNKVTENATKFDKVRKTITKKTCFLDDILLQNEVQGLIGRLQVLLKLENSTVEKPTCECPKLSDSSSVLPRYADNGAADIPFSISWDETSNTLSIRLLPRANSPAANQRQNLRPNANPTNKQLVMNPSACKAKHCTSTSTSSKSASPSTPRRLLSSRNSTDSGFFSTCFCSVLSHFRVMVIFSSPHFIGSYNNLIPKMLEVLMRRKSLPIQIVEF